LFAISLFLRILLRVEHVGRAKIKIFTTGGTEGHRGMLADNFLGNLIA
jgi:hypothetical protein